MVLFILRIHILFPLTTRSEITIGDAAGTVFPSVKLDIP